MKSGPLIHKEIKIGKEKKFPFKVARGFGYM
jgi:hypothetical protein